MMFLVHPLIISLFMGSTLKIIFSFKSTCIFLREHEKGSTDQRTVLCKKKMGKQDMLVNTMQRPLNFKRISIVWRNDFEAIIPTQFLQSPFWIFVM